jgi:hypothetical protein
LLCVVSVKLSTRRWLVIKGKLSFCRLTQDGDSEGCLHLDRLPNAAEAIAIREALGIRNWRTMTAIAWTNSALIWRKTPPIR